MFTLHPTRMSVFVVPDFAKWVCMFFSFYRVSVHLMASKCMVDIETPLLEEKYMTRDGFMGLSFTRPTSLLQVT